MAAPFGTDGAGWGYACPHHAAAPFSGPVWRSPSSELPKHRRLAQQPREEEEEDGVVMPTSCLLFCEKRWHRMAGFCLFVTPPRAALPTFGRLAWFVITHPGDSRLSCLYFWDNTCASRSDAQRGYLLPVAALNYEEGQYHQQCCKACGVRRKFVFWVCLVGTPRQRDLAHWACCRKWMG